MSVSISTILDKRRRKITKKFPIKLRVRFESKVELYPTIYDLSEEDFNKFAAPRISDDLQKIRSNLQKLETDAKKFVENLAPLSFEAFERDFVALSPFLQKKKAKMQPVSTDTYEFDMRPYEKRFPILQEVHPDRHFISAAFASSILRLLKEERLGSALNYRDAYNSLKRFRGNVRFSEITTTYLVQYEHWMIRQNNCSRTWVGINLRALRAVFNEAIDAGLIRREAYPFGRRKYQIPSSKKTKKSLELEDVRKIYEYKPESIPDRKAKAYWLFCYFGNGMNPKDMAYLKYKNFDGEYLSFIRAKTDRSTRSDPKEITAYLNEEMRQIIDEWGNKDSNPDNYIFPILKPDDDPMQQFNSVKTLVKFINVGMKNVVGNLKLSKEKVRNMEARHTFSTIMKRSGASTEFIQEALGHADKATTEIYLDSFEKEVKKEFSKQLTAFKKSPATKRSHQKRV